MKLKVSKKEIKSNVISDNLIAIGYCEAQYLLRGKQPFAYSAGVYGWSCDYYQIDGVIISTGYSPTGARVDYKLLIKYEDKAAKIAESGDAWELREKKTAKLLRKFLAEVKK